MIDLRPIAVVIGILLMVLGAAMLAPGVIDLTLGLPDWSAFMGASLATLFVGGTLYLGNRGRPIRLTIRQAFLLTTLAWGLLSVFAGLPFLFSIAGLTLADSVFEAVSGLTTTGSTILVGLAPGPITEEEHSYEVTIVKEDGYWRGKDFFGARKYME